MSRVKHKGTAPEMVVRRLLFSLGYRYRLHLKNLPGTPDIVFPSRRKVIFVNGCFWHYHGCAFSHIPSYRREYWGPKLERNKQRDQEATYQLNAEGWSVITVWECELKNLDELKHRLIHFLKKS